MRIVGLPADVHVALGDLVRVPLPLVSNA
jgi:hypothetical protein